jgi:uncharacterized protein
LCRVRHEEDLVGSALLSDRLPSHRPIVRALDKALAPIRAQNPGYEISVTSLSAIAARASANMIEKLNCGLTVEVLFVAGFIVLAFRS